MSQLTRLDAVAPGLARLLMSASPAKQRAAAKLACDRAVSTPRLEDDAIAAGLEVLGGHADNTDLARERVRALSLQLDEQYFRLDETGDLSDKATVLEAFSRARAAAAVAHAMSDDASDLHEPIHEALSAVENQSARAREVESLLR